jgi:hypothetical protein
MMGAFLPTQNDDTLIIWLRELAERPEFFGDGDFALQRLLIALKSYEHALGEAPDAQEFARNVRVINERAATTAAWTRLRAVLSCAGAKGDMLWWILSKVTTQDNPLSSCVFLNVQFGTTVPS